MRVLLMILLLLLLAMPFQALPATVMVEAAPAAVCCDAGQGGHEPCCPIGEPCDCGCPAVIVQPVNAEEPDIARIFSGVRVHPDPAVIPSALTRRDPPPFPPPRAGR